MVFVPSFENEWGFLIACKKIKDCNRISYDDDGAFNVKYLKKEINRRNIDKEKHLKYYDHITHQKLFSIPPSIRSRL